MWSGLQWTITAQHQVSMTTTPYLICIFCLHYLLTPNMVTLLLRCLSLNPLFITSSFNPFSKRCVFTLCIRYMCVQPYSLWVYERGSPCDIRAVLSLRDKQTNSSVNQEVGCRKGCSWDFEIKGTCSMLSQSPQWLHRQRISLTPSALLHWRLCRNLAPTSTSPKVCVYQTITGMLNQAPGAHTHIHTHTPTHTHKATLSSTQHLSAAASTEKKTRSITLDSTAKGKEQRRAGGRQQAFCQQKKHTEQVAHYLQPITSFPNVICHY